MKTFILCGGFGTRLDYEGKLKAKPMIKIGSKPILIYIIENFILQGFNEFVFCLGHKSETITNYFIKEKKKYVKIIYNVKMKNVLVYPRGANTSTSSYSNPPKNGKIWGTNM